MIVKFERNRYGLSAMISHFCMMALAEQTFMNETESCKIPKCDFV